MDKPFKTYNQQLKILRTRNLNIPNGSKALRILRRENYYNIINGYKDIFLDKGYATDRFKYGTSFDDIYALYSFDRNLRSILLKYILRLESSLKTKIAYRFSEKYPSNFSCFDISNFRSNITSVTNLIAHISNDIKNNVETPRPGTQTSPFSHYLNVHKELPLWVLIKRLSLGETSYFYTALTDDLQLKVLNDIYTEYQQEYGLSPRKSAVINDTSSFSQMVKFVVTFRNLCAHGERMYDYIAKYKGRIPSIQFFFLDPSPRFNSKVVDVVRVLGLFLMKSDYKALLKELSIEVKSLSDELPQSTMNAVLIKAGFSKNWKSDLMLPRRQLID